MKKSALTVLMSLLLIVFLNTTCFGGWLIYSKSGFKGRILDAETKEPIKGVVVTAAYWADALVGGPGGGNPKIIHIKEALTDEKGEFTIPSYKTILNPIYIEDHVIIYIYKRGYASCPNFYPKPYPTNYIGLTILFSGEIGAERVVKIKNESRTVTITNGILELPKLTTWQERRKARHGELSAKPEYWPLLHKMIEEEDEWLWKNKGWRRR